MRDVGPGVNLIDKHRWRSNLRLTNLFLRCCCCYLTARCRGASPFPPDIGSKTSFSFAESASRNCQPTTGVHEPTERTNERAKFPVSLHGVEETSSANERSRERNEETIEFEGSEWSRVKLESRVERNEKQGERENRGYLDAYNPFRPFRFRGIGRRRFVFPPPGFHPRSTNVAELITTRRRWISFRTRFELPDDLCDNIHAPHIHPPDNVSSAGGRENSWAGSSPGHHHHHHHHAGVVHVHL